MASSSHSPSPTIFFFFSLQFLMVTLTFFQIALAQAQAPAAASCQPQILSLLPCAPFVQGMDQSPTESCCNILNQIDRQQPGCICLLLRSSNFNSLPINSTLALQLPQLCHLQVHASDCSGVPSPPTLPSERAPNSTATQVSFGARNESSIACKQ
ncbi:hypothetical protein SAY87_003088 [Trapa incisa]|uniref:Bifunctional inhibitor/plant lipid transfer protein/seed storage helical domain-containing protein n=1 Tax=Trapa incisa TaxID=236973 RepID=A0AAN7KRX7_9MYRT|nr:hypothetical protein SAY87_003088 [Trapa incisa]